MNQWKLESVIGAAAIALTALTLTAATANAEPESSIQSRCQADGGQYATWTATNGNTVSSCCYRTNQGLKTVHHLYCFYYVNGQYDGSQIFNQQPPGTTSPPPPPPPVAVR